jgi:hypothetical protein
MPALGAPGTDDRPASTGRHANEKAMRALAADYRGLIGAFHDKTSKVIANRIAN